MINKNFSAPLYAQIKQNMLQKIKTGEYKPGDSLPGERKLSERYGVSRVTIRRVISELADEGILCKRQGKDTVVCELPENGSVENTLGSLYGFAEELLQKGLEIKISLLESGFEPPPPAVKKELKIEGGKAFFFRRLVVKDGAPMVLNDSYVGESLGFLIQDLDMTRDLIFSYLEKVGYSISHGAQKITAGAASKEIAKALGVTAGSPVLEIVRTVYAKDKSPILFEKSYYRSDLYYYSVKLKRNKLY